MMCFHYVKPNGNYRLRILTAAGSIPSKNPSNCSQLCMWTHCLFNSRRNTFNYRLHSPNPMYQANENTNFFIDKRKFCWMPVIECNGLHWNQANVQVLKWSPWWGQKQSGCQVKEALTRFQFENQSSWTSPFLPADPKKIDSFLFGYIKLFQNHDLRASTLGFHCGLFCPQDFSEQAPWPLSWVHCSIFQHAQRLFRTLPCCSQNFQAQLKACFYPFEIYIGPNIRQMFQCTVLSVVLWRLWLTDLVGLFDRTLVWSVPTNWTNCRTCARRAERTSTVCSRVLSTTPCWTTSLSTSRCLSTARSPSSHTA